MLPMLTEEQIELHLKVARKAGKEASCGNKQFYVNYELAWKAAARLNGCDNAHHKVEAYPCPFCGWWHIGREMTVDEMKEYLKSPWQSW